MSLFWICILNSNYKHSDSLRNTKQLGGNPLSLTFDSFVAGYNFTLVSIFCVFTGAFSLVMFTCGKFDRGHLIVKFGVILS